MRSDEARAPAGTVRAAVGTVLVTGIVCAAGAVLAQRSLMAEGAQAFLAQTGASVLGADGAKDEKLTARAVATRMASGAAAAIAAALVLVTVARATGALGPLAVSTSLFAALIGLLDATLVALRDEFLLRGLVLRVARGRSRARALALVACGLASAAWALGASGSSGLPLTRAVVEALLGTCFGAMWLRERGGFMAITAHVAWLFATTSGPLVLRATSGSWGGGDGGFLAGGCALAVMALACGAAVRWSLRGETSTASAPLG